jgi:hypothetical protein
MIEVWMYLAFCSKTNAKLFPLLYLAVLPSTDTYLVCLVWSSGGYIIWKIQKYWKTFKGVLAENKQMQSVNAIAEFL